MIIKLVASKSKRVMLALSAICAVVALAVGAALPALAASAQTSLAGNFAAAAQEFGVPQSILLAVSYNESHWQSNAGMSSDGGYGIMDLRTYASTAVSGRDGDTVSVPRQQANHYTLDEAASLLGVSKDTVKTNEQQNIRGGAAVLAQEARQLNGGKLPTSVNDWYSTVAQYSGATTNSGATNFADDVYASIGSGTSLTTPSGQAMNLQAVPGLHPNKTISALGLKSVSLNAHNVLGSNPECPSTVHCRFIPAAYAQNDPNDPTNYGNYDPANRPHDMQIRYIFIHDGEGSYDSIINHFQDPTALDSAQYVISTQGDITQMVLNEHVSWGVGNWNMNMHGINIEHEGFAAQGASWYTPAMYQQSATLVRWLANKYHIPLDRQHILGHDSVMRLSATKQAAQHWDPGPYWDWNYFMDLVKGDTPPEVTPDIAYPLQQGDVVKIAPHFATNQPVVTDCQTGTCITLPKQGTNFAYLHAWPNSNAPLLSDPYLHTDGSAGTTQDNDWGDKASSEEKYVVAAVQGDWVGIWYAGQIGWFNNPFGAHRVANLSSSATVTPRAGRSSIPVYTSAYPEASAYPAAIPVRLQNTPYTMTAGQKYTVDAKSVGSDYYYDATANYSLPDDHMIVVGKQRYYEITFNHHAGFVKVEDVTLRQ